MTCLTIQKHIKIIALISPGFISKFNTGEIYKMLIVGAGSEVTKNIPGHENIFGVPAKQKRLK
jgi:acetyltransferase-like isoleucine patch superfamily enzyme